MKTFWTAACLSGLVIAATAFAVPAQSATVTQELSAQKRPTVSCETRRHQCLKSYSTRGPFTGVPGVPPDKVRLCYDEYRQCLKYHR